MLFVCGIDVSKATLDACLLAEGAARPAFASFANDEGGFEALARWALSLAPGGGVRFAMEHTGCYHRALLRSLRSRGLAALALNARRCRDLAKGLGVLDKDDRVDAEVVARCVLMSRPCARPEPPAREALREVSHRVEQLKGQLAKERTRLKEPRLSARVEASIRRSIAWLEGELEAVEAGWLEALEDAPELMAAYRLALTVPQVGPCTARALVSELPDASDVGDPRRLCALSGLVPRRRRSGASLQAPDRLSPCCNRRQEGDVHARRAGAEALARAQGVPRPAGPRGQAPQPGARRRRPQDPAPGARRARQRNALAEKTLDNMNGVSG